MKGIIPIVIIDFNSFRRTLEYIEDFIKDVVIDYDLTFIIVDTTENEENYRRFKGALSDRTQINSCKEMITSNNRVLEAMKYNIFIENKTVDVVHIKCKGNYGFAIGNNIGAEIAKENYKFDYILFSNSDITFNDGLNLNRLINEFSSDPSIALVGPKVVGLDGKNQSPCKKLSLWARWNFNSIIWPVNSIIRIKALNTYDDLITLDKNSYVYRIIGAFMIFDFNKFLEIGMFDEGTFLYAEELIIAEKLINKGYNTLYINDEILIHEQGGSVDKKFSNYETLKNKFKSEMYYYRHYRQVNKYLIFISKILFNIYLYKLIILNNIRKNIIDGFFNFRGDK